MHRYGQNIYLIGPMGSGKTTIGRLIAKDLGYEFHDCDEDIEKITGASVNLIFDIEGEAGFRQRETNMLQKISKKKGLLVATGGGVITRAENRKLLRRSGLVVWLNTSVMQQIERLSHDKSRPLLRSVNRKEVLQKLATERNPWYSKVADLTFTSPNRHSGYAANALCKLIKNYWSDETKEDFHAQH
ncbi:MAG: shikimate kinase [Lysobacterales bacterium]|jgi:shikimate kinase